MRRFHRWTGYYRLSGKTTTPIMDGVFWISPDGVTEVIFYQDWTN